MGKLRNDLNAFKEQQRELNQGFIERLNSLDAQNQKSTIRSNENIEAIQTIDQIRNLSENFFPFDNRIKRIEELNPDIRSLKEQFEKKNEPILTGVQNQSIQYKLDSFDERIKKLEALNQAKDTQVVFTNLIRFINWL